MILSLLMLALLGTEPAVTPEEVTRPPVLKGADLDLLREVRNMAARIEELRGQEFDRPPVAVRAPRDTRRVAAEIRAASVLPAENLGARGRAWADIGLGGPESPRTLLFGLAADLEGVACDPSQGRLLVDPELLTDRDFEPSSEESAPSSLLMATGVRPDEPQVAHMLMHLRQFERSGVDHLQDTTDRLLASAAWQEGEANLVAIHYLFRTMGIANEVLEIGLDPGQVLEGDLLPAGLKSEAGDETTGLLGFVYREGFAQIARAFRSGGWAAVERTVTERPTTRDLLHPDRSPLGAGDVPPHGLSLPEGFRLADRDVLGEQAIVVLVATRTGKDNLGLLAGDGWTGDALYRWERPGSGLTLWVTRWTSEEAADDFEYGFARGLRARFPGSQLVGAGEGRRALEAGERVFRMDREAREVRIRIASPELDRLLEGTSEAAAVGYLAR